MIQRDQFTWLRRRCFPTARTILLEHDIPQLPLAQFRNVLVVGAGQDPYRAQFAQVEHYVRMDIRALGGSIDVFADAHVLPFGNESFDCVFASEVLEHLHDPRRFTAEALRVVQPSGAVVLTVPFMFQIHADPSDFWRPTREAFQKLFPECVPLQVYGQGNRLHVISDLITTSFGKWSPFFPLRVFNHLLRFGIRGPASGGSLSTAPSGFVVIARKL